MSIRNRENHVRIRCDISAFDDYNYDYWHRTSRADGSPSTRYEPSIRDPISVFVSIGLRCGSDNPVQNKK